MSNQPILKINFSIGGCDGHVVGYGFVERGDSKSFLTTVNLFFMFIDSLHSMIFFDSRYFVCTSRMARQIFGT